MTELAGIVIGWLRPMFEPHPVERYLPAVTLAAAVALSAVGLLAAYGTTRPGPLLGGQARWRYRSRALRERLARARTWLVPPDRTTGWWTTRLEFAVAIGALIVPALILRASMEPSFGRSPTEDRLALMAPFAGAIGIAIGIAWMVRIYRAPLGYDSRAYWRYRDGA